MRFKSLRDYYRLRLKAVDPDFREWEDGFSFDNIPSNILDGSWHLTFNPFTYTGTAQTCLGFSCPVVLRVFLKGHRCPQDAIDKALDLADSIISEICAPVNRLSQAYIKNVLPSNVDIQALDSSNDNAVILILGFNNTIYL